MAKLLIVSHRVGAVTQTVVEFPSVTYAEDALREINKCRIQLELEDIATKVFAVRLYDPKKGVVPWCEHCQCYHGLQAGHIRK